ncbi:unnamed protein product, partial [Symbiodinium necroappetens]
GPAFFLHRNPTVHGLGVAKLPRLPVPLRRCDRPRRLRPCHAPPSLAGPGCMHPAGTPRLDGPLRRRRLRRGEAVGLPARRRRRHLDTRRPGLPSAFPVAPVLEGDRRSHLGG